MYTKHRKERGRENNWLNCLASSKLCSNVLRGGILFPGELGFVFFSACHLSKQPLPTSGGETTAGEELVGRSADVGREGRDGWERRVASG